MANNCKDDQIRRDGTGQVQRFLPALDTSANLLDDRKPEDILVFAKHYAELVRFYDADAPVELKNPASTDNNNDNNENAAPAVAKEVVFTWKEFFSNDIAVVIASIAQYKNRIDWLRQEFEDKRKKGDNEPTAENYKALFIGVIEHLTRINKWFTRSIADHPLKNELEIKINSTLTPALEKLIAFGKGYTVLNEGKLGLRNHYAIFKEPPWNILYDEIHADVSIYAGASRQKKIAHAALYIDDIFLTVLKTYKELIDRTEFYLTSAFESYPEHQPHMALFIAFIKLFGHAQKELNSITRRHLEFYYRDVLHLHERPANPDAVYLIYELAKEAAEYVLEEGTPLTAGKDGIGKELIYKTDTELVINKATVKELKTIFQDKNTSGTTPPEREIIRAVYAATVANSEDGNGRQFKEPETAWPAMGYFKPQSGLDINRQPVILNAVGKEAEMGFAIASPQLFLAEGLRKILIRIPFDRGNNLDTLNKSLEIQLTGEKEWIIIKKEQNDTVAPDVRGYSITENVITINIPTSDHAIIAIDKKIHGEEYDTKYPVIKFILRDSSKYEALKGAFISMAKDGASVFNITVKVTGVSKLSLSNGDGAIDPTKPFQPFTLTPKPNSDFIIGSKEVFSKKLSLLELVLDRKITGSGKTELTNLVQIHDGMNSFHVQSELKYQNEWKKLTIDAENNDVIFFPPESNSITFDILNKSNIDLFARKVDEELLPSVPDNAESNLKFSLHYFAQKNNKDSEVSNLYLFSSEDPPIAFGYFQLLSLVLELKAVTINYNSSQDFEAGIDQYFLIYPFGVTETFPSLNFPPNADYTNFKDYDKAKNYLVSQTNFFLPQLRFGSNNADLGGKNQYFAAMHQQGNLYIGIENLVLPQNLSLLFKIADGTAEDNDAEPPTINWSYLSNNYWRPLPAESIVSDSTYGLQTTGIILIDIPTESTTNNTIITTGLHWLCASVDTGADKIPKIIDIIAQANKAIFFDQQNDPEHYRNPLPAKTIAKLVTKAPEVKLITQPFESFDRKMREEGQVFYTRASERLRHKHRAITTWDYEHLVLQHFPWIYKVKCLSNTDPLCLCRHEEGDSTKCCCAQIAPGHVLIVPVSNLRNKNAVDILKPRTGRRTLIQIEEYLKKLTSPFVHVHAKNPLFEEIKTSFKVKFHTGTDKGRYLRQLNEDIIKYLTPWAFDETKDVVFGGKVWASNVINFIEELRYVDYITCFRMIHIINDCCEKDTYPDIPCEDLRRTDFIEPLSRDNVAEHEEDKKITDRFTSEIQASSSRAILTSVKKHCIELIDEPKEKDDCNCS